MTSSAIVRNEPGAKPVSLFQAPRDPTELRSVVRYPSSLVVGDGAADSVGEEARALGSRALVVTYGSPRSRDQAGPTGRVMRSLEGAKVRPALFELAGEPDQHAVEACAARIGEVGAELVIGLGGGSILDVAKAASALAGNGRSWSDYQFGNATLARAGVPVVAIPTTAGTGSEATTVAVVHDRNRGLIKSVSSPLMLPRVVIIDPTLTWSCPPRLTALAGLDAITHAIESYLSPRANGLTRALGQQALLLLVNPLLRAVADGADHEARASLAIGSHLAGQALAAGVGAAHILAQPISATLSVAHGEALAAVFTAVLAFNEQRPTPLLTDIAAAFGNPPLPLSQAMREFVESLGLPTCLSAIGGRARDIPEILSKVAQSTAHIWTNARPVTLDDLDRILLVSI
jgi:1,3-propanediol dehydrogenase/alcohol dehydrogenase